MKTWLYAAVASAALALAAPAANAATVVSLDQITANTETGFFGETVTASPFTSIFTFTTDTAGFASVSVTKTVLSGDLTFSSAFLNGTPLELGALPGGGLGGGSGAVFVSAGEQTFTINTNGVGSFGGSVGFTAVPGPIAGAGLPALLALGGFVWARRRKSQGAALPV